jgi:HSP20 family protein
MKTMDATHALSNARVLAGLREELGRLLGDLRGDDRRTSPREGAPAVWNPPADIDESAEAFVFRLDLPGVMADDVDVSTARGVLTVRGERRASPAAAGVTPHRRERFTGGFTRSFALDASADGDRARASYAGGVLEIVVPKRPAGHGRGATTEIAA